MVLIFISQMGRQIVDCDLQCGGLNWQARARSHCGQSWLQRLQLETPVEMKGFYQSR